MYLYTAQVKQTATVRMCSVVAEILQGLGLHVCCADEVAEKHEASVTHQNLRTPSH